MNIDVVPEIIDKGFKLIKGIIIICDFDACKTFWNIYRWILELYVFFKLVFVRDYTVLFIDWLFIYNTVLHLDWCYGFGRRAFTHKLCQTILVHYKQFMNS